MVTAMMCWGTQRFVDGEGVGTTAAKATAALVLRDDNEDATPGCCAGDLADDGEGTTTTIC